MSDPRTMVPPGTVPLMELAGEVHEADDSCVVRPSCQHIGFRASRDWVWPRETCGTCRHRDDERLRLWCSVQGGRCKCWEKKEKKNG